MKDIIDFLKKSRYLIKIGSCRFEERSEDGRSYLSVLVEDFNISLDEAWVHIKNLNQHMIFIDEKPNYYDRSSAYIFKKEMNQVFGYIKVKIEYRNSIEELVVISFHIDKRGNR